MHNFNRGDKVVLIGEETVIYKVFTDVTFVHPNEVALTLDHEFHDWNYLVPISIVRLATETELIVYG